MTETVFERVQAFFNRDICTRAANPLKEGVVFYLEVAGQPFTVTKQKGKLITSEGKPPRPEMSFFIPETALNRLCSVQTQDIGEMGVEVLRLVTAPSPADRITSKVHIGVFDLLMKGYLGVLPLGGPTVMKYLASKGFTSIAKVKDALSRMRS